MKSIDVYGIGNALVDLIVSVDEDKLESLQLEKATMRLVSSDEQNHLIEKIGSKDLKMVSGGSVANSIYSLSKLGAKTALSASIADDKYGLFYKSEFEAADTNFTSPARVGKNTGTCLVIITPDGERTMRTCLGASSDFDFSCIDEDLIKSSKWIFIEGYLLANPGKVEDWLPKTLELCKKHNTKVAFTCSESWVVESFREYVDQVVLNASFIFANEAESCALTKAESIEGASEILSSKHEYTCLTVGDKGAFVSFEGKVFNIPAKATKVVDLNGAGDMCAAGFLYGILIGKTAADSGKIGCHLASKVIEHTGARYPGDIKEAFLEVC